MKLNLAKCIFGMTSGKFHSFLVTQRGIEVNLEKIKAIMDMAHPTSKKQVQELTGRIASLNHFISRLAEKSLPFFRTLYRSDCFQRTDECWSAFEALKNYLKNPPVLAKPLEGEVLYLYLSASDEAVSTVLVRVGKDGQQKPVYYISKVLHDAETRYPKVQKLVYLLVIATKHLRPYF